MNAACRLLTAGDIGTFRGGSGFPTRFQGRKSGDLPFFKVSDMNNPGNELFMRRANHYIDESQRKAMGAARIPAQAIVFAKVGAAVFLERKRILAQDSCIDNNMAAFIVDQGRIDVRFAHYLLTAFKMSSLVATTALPSLNSGQLRSIPLRVPEDLGEQRRIATVLSDADALIAVLERTIAKKQAIKRGLTQRLLTGRARLPGFDDPWREGRLGDYASMGSGGTPPSSVARYYGGGVPWVSISDMTRVGRFVRATEKTLSAEGLTNSAAKLYQDGVVLYAMYASLGECAIAGGRMASSQAILGILPGPELERDYLYYTLAARKEQVRELGQQGTQSNLNAGIVRDFRIRLPDVPEQAAISGVLGDVDDELEGLQRRLEKARAVKQGMMQQLLMGRTRLPVGAAA